MKAIVYEHEEGIGLGLLERPLREAGFELELRRHEILPSDVDAPMLVVLGGTMSAYDLRSHPYLHRELEVMRKRLARQRPILGVCLGSQMLAAAAGARVFAGDAGFEMGTSEVHLTDAGRKDAAFAQLPASFDAAQWHGDTHDEVPLATLLGSSDRYRQQIFRIGDNYGIQFHPELDGKTLISWAEHSPNELARANKTMDELRSEDAPRLDRARPVIERMLSALAAHYARAAAASR